MEVKPAKKFGNEVVEIIDGCTECDTYPKPPRIERKHKYLENLRHASPSVRLVSLADKLHNARSLEELENYSAMIR